MGSPKPSSGAAPGKVDKGWAPGNYSLVVLWNSDKVSPRA